LDKASFHGETQVGRDCPHGSEEDSGMAARFSSRSVNIFKSVKISKNKRHGPTVQGKSGE
jgi:hypothetical protein